MIRMATLEMVPLRSSMPPSGLVTLRYPTIRLNAPLTSTTPQVFDEPAGTTEADDRGNRDEEGRDAR